LECQIQQSWRGVVARSKSRRILELLWEGRGVDDKVKRRSVMVVWWRMVKCEELRQAGGEGWSPVGQRWDLRG
jgi:hypothetical protein